MDSNINRPPRAMHTREMVRRLQYLTDSRLQEVDAARKEIGERNPACLNKEDQLAELRHVSALIIENADAIDERAKLCAIKDSMICAHWYADVILRRHDVLWEYVRSAAETHGWIPKGTTAQVPVDWHALTERVLEHFNHVVVMGVDYYYLPPEDE